VKRQWFVLFLLSSVLLLLATAIYAQDNRTYLPLVENTGPGQAGPTSTATATNTPTDISLPQATPTATGTSTPTATSTLIPTSTSTATSTPTATSTSTSTNTPTATSTSTSTSTPTSTSTATPTPTTPATGLGCVDLDGAYVFSQESPPVYLGFFGNEFASESIMNQFGTYGSEFNPLSVRNEFGDYGSPFRTYSANNDFTSKPPGVFRKNTLIAYLTTNRFITGGIPLEAIDASCVFYSSFPDTGTTSSAAPTPARP
jgi:hypothetical protein